MSDCAAAGDGSRRLGDDCVTCKRLQSVKNGLELAKATAKAWPRPWSGGAVEYVWRSVHAVEVELLQVLPPDEFIGRSAEIMAMVELCLPATDSRRVDLHQRYSRGSGRFDPADRSAAVRALEAAYTEYDDQQTRVRSFRNLLVAVSVVMMAAVVGLGWASTSGHVPISLCSEQACPTGKVDHDSLPGGDVIFVEVLGAAAAMLVGMTSLNRVRGTSTPYAVPLWSTVLKIPAGALAAVLGLLLLEAEIVPVASLTKTAQIVAWALVLGASQQAFTALVDRQAQVVLNSVATTEHDVVKRS